MAAELICSWNKITTDSARLFGLFQGGEATFTRYRYLKLVIDGFGAFEIKSQSAGGDGSSFVTTVNGLSPGTNYTWKATLGFEADDAGTITWLENITDSGSFKTEGEEIPEIPGLQSGQIYVYQGGAYKLAVPYVYNGGWNQCSTKMLSEILTQ